MKKSNKFSPEVRERAVRLVQEHRSGFAKVFLPFAQITPPPTNMPMRSMTPCAM